MDLRSFLQYLQYERRYSQHTIIAYENDLLQFSDFLKKNYDSIVFRGKHVHALWLVSLMEQGGARSINRKFTKTFFKFNMKNGME
jgi:integrase/recombinase XerC